MKSTTEIDFRKNPFIAQIATWRYNKQIITLYEKADLAALATSNCFVCLS
jgi:hypothetical protein